MHAMAMYDSKPIETRKPIDRRAAPVLAAGDHVRLTGNPGTMPGHVALDGAFGTVLRVVGDSVVLEMDEPFEAGGLTQTVFYSRPSELKKVRVAGRMGSRVLFSDDDEDAADS
ncbi:MAG: hypothetical protein QOJ13_3412 [Gaiellales bacterium]|jgi:hypothetical protein|nr:hypothetical protein [Gaiellales bacterium]